MYDVLNRAVARAQIFERDGDYAAFERVIEEARARVPMRLLAYCVMPNHWHLVLWPRSDGDLSEYMRRSRTRSGGTPPITRQGRELCIKGASSRSPSRRTGTC